MVIFEKSLKMAYKEYELCIAPSPDIIIWRYISLQKFKLMIKNKALFFCRADIFSDPFEGTIPKKEAVYREKSLGDKQSIESISNLHRKLKAHFIVNFWHINNGENDAMWQLYLKNNYGVAIKTTVKNLLESFIDTEEEINCSIVRYIDYDNDIWMPPTIKGYNMFTPILHKRKEFSHENELRLVHQIEYNNRDIDEFWREQPMEEGKNIHVDLTKLINVVCTAPTSNEMQIKRIKSIIQQNGFDFPVEKSKLDNEPYY